MNLLWCFVEWYSLNVVIEEEGGHLLTNINAKMLVVNIIKILAHNVMSVFIRKKLNLKQF